MAAPSRSFDCGGRLFELGHEHFDVLEFSRGKEHDVTLGPEDADEMFGHDLAAAGERREIRHGGAAVDVEERKALGYVSIVGDARDAGGFLLLRLVAQKRLGAGAAEGG